MVETQTVWQMIKEAIKNLGGRASNTQIKEYIIGNYSNVNERTILDQTIRCTINHDSRIHYGSNQSPRVANSEIDFLYQNDRGVGIVELYDPNKHGIWEIKKDKEGNLKVVQRKYGIDQIILKEHIINSINISKIIIENDLEDKRLSQVDDADENRRIYSEIKTTYIDKYKFRYKGTPNLIIKEFLDYYIRKYNLTYDFDIKHFSFYGQKVNSYIWACIIKKDEIIKDRVASHYPQLYILINKEGIKFGFSYGTLVGEDDKIISIVREEDQLGLEILKIIRNNPDLKVQLGGDASTLPKPENEVIINELSDLKTSWNRDILLLSYFKEEKIPHNIGEIIENTFNILINVFKQTSFGKIIREKQAWKCPKFSCSFNEININRNERNLIEGNTYKEIIVHFLRHLKTDNKYFGAIDIYDVFEKYAPPDILSEEDLSIYSNSSNITWKTQIRSTLASLTREGYLETDELDDIPDFYNKNITDKRQLRSRKRTEMFFEEYSPFYDDWVLDYIIEPLLRPDFSLFNDSNVDIEEIRKALINKLQIILLGPPGTSKSYLAVEIAKDLGNKIKNYEIVQFHPSYSYEDFVEGITTDNSQLGIHFKTIPKTFRLLCEKAQNYPEEYFILIIDEINRGNVEKIFGELIYSLEKRGEPIKTLYSEKKLVIPPNLLIIGTMNTVDLSIANIDAALRRRFYIISMMPDDKILENWLETKFGEKFLEFQEELVELMGQLNKRISLDKIYLGPYRQLGHTYFFVKSHTILSEQINNFELEWKYSIRPLILEYLNFNEELMKEYDDMYQNFKTKILNAE